MIDAIIELDKQLFLIFNGMHTKWLDPVMELFSKTAASVPLYAFLLYQLFRVFKERAWGVLLSIGLFKRPLPSRAPIGISTSTILWLTYASSAES